MSNTSRLLIVDDEQRVLDVLVRTFEDVYRIKSCRGAAEALKVVRDWHPQVILTDQRMPGMTGLELLKESHKLGPTSVNIILTAFSDLNDAIEAINSALVYRYLFKPWETDELLLTVRQAFEKFHLKYENDRLADELVSKNRELESNIKLLRLAQEKLLRSEKLSVVGQLTASIGHELRNPLSRMKTAASLLKTEVGADGHEVDELIRIIEHEVLISEKIIQDLLGFSKDQQPLFELVEINPIVQSACERSEIPDHIKLNLELHDSIPAVKGDKIHLQQVLLNLISNAVEAMDKDGILTLRTGQCNRHVEVVVEDTGKGIPAENIEKVFDPLFTTRTKGIGLGMCLVKTLVDKHGGDISLVSVPDSGTTVKVRLPIP